MLLSPTILLVFPDKFRTVIVKYTVFICKEYIPGDVD